MDQVILMDDHFGDDERMLAGDNKKESFSEDYLLDGFESYFYEVNERLTVSRMVSDSVTRGLVNAITEEAAEKIALKEAEIEVLNKRLSFYTSDAHQKNGSKLADFDKMCRFRSDLDEQLLLLKKDVEELQSSGLHDHGDSSSAKKLIEIIYRVDRTRNLLSSAFEKICKMFEPHKEHELLREISSTSIQTVIKELHDDFEKKLFEQRVKFCTLQENWEERISEITELRDELDSFSKSLLQDPGLLQYYDNLDKFSEVSSIGRQNSVASSIDSLNEHKSFDGDEDHIQKKPGRVGETTTKTSDFVHVGHMSKEEMINHFKSETLKMKRQHEMAIQEKTEELFELKRALLKFKEKGSFSIRRDSHPDFIRTKILVLISKVDEMISKQKKSMPAVDIAYDERFSLVMKENYYLLQVLAGAADSVNKISLLELSDTNISNLVKRFAVDLEEFMVKKNSDEVLHNLLQRENFDDLELFSNIVQEMHAVIFRGVALDANDKQESMLLELKQESDSMKSRLDETMKQMQDYERDIAELTQERLRFLNALNELKEKNAKLHGIIEEDRKLQQLTIEKTGLEKELLNSLCKSMNKLCKEFQDHENRLVQNISDISIRLESANSQICPIIHHVGQLKSKSLRYKHILEIKNSNLQKAESEVDVLGDEVDSLLNVLGKVYFALNHYAPVLKHYPGVMETLQLVKRELKGSS